MQINQRLSLIEMRTVFFVLY